MARKTILTGSVLYTYGYKLLGHDYLEVRMVPSIRFPDAGAVAFFFLSGYIIYIYGAAVMDRNVGFARMGQLIFTFSANGGSLYWGISSGV